MQKILAKSTHENKEKKTSKAKAGDAKKQNLPAIPVENTLQAALNRQSITKSNE